MQATWRWALTTTLKQLHLRRFVVWPKRCIAKRTFAGLGRCQRLSKDYEANPRSSETCNDIAMIRRMALVCFAGNLALLRLRRYVSARSNTA